MDVDAILARKPQVFLWMNWLHTNIEGSKHRKRYEDVLELLMPDRRAFHYDHQYKTSMPTSQSSRTSHSVSVLAPLDVGCEPVHPQNDLRFARQDGIDIHLSKAGLCNRSPACNDFQTSTSSATGCVLRLQNPDHGILAAAVTADRFAQHCGSLPTPGAYRGTA